MSWPYKNIKQDEFEEALNIVEKTIVEYGGAFITVSEENEYWYSSGTETKEFVKQNVYRFREEFVRVDKVYYPDKPAIVLEFSNYIDGPYEDAEPFPYNLPLDDMIEEIKQAMLIVPYPNWQEHAKKEKWMPKTGNLLIWKNRYAIYNEWENAYLVNIETKEIVPLGSYYGDPEIALLNATEKIAIVAGRDGIGIYNIEKREFRFMDVNIQEWIKSMDIIGNTLRVICEDEKVYEFSA